MPVRSLPPAQWKTAGVTVGVGDTAHDGADLDGAVRQRADVGVTQHLLTLASGHRRGWLG